MKKINSFLLLSSFLFLSFAFKTSNVFSAPDAKKAFASFEKRGFFKVSVSADTLTFTVPCAFGEMIPSGRTKYSIYQISKFIKKAASYEISVEGHTDNIAPRRAATIKKYPDLAAYSLGRANNIKDLLVKYGLKANKINSVGKAEKVPVAENSTRQGRAKNRRVVIIAKLSYAAASTTPPAEVSPPARTAPPAAPRDSAPPETTLRGRTSR